MPATVLFIRFNPECCAPIRVFVNRKRVLLSHQVSINEKSVIQLSSINLLRLSNFDVTNLIFDIKISLKELLFETPLKELFDQRSLLRSTKVSRELGNKWKCKVMVSLGYIADLRYKLGFLQNDMEFLELKNIEASSTDGRDVALLTKEITFNFSPVLKEEDDEVEQVEDDKKSLKYKLHRTHVLNSKVTDPLDIYVLQRPRG